LFVASSSAQGDVSDPPPADSDVEQDELIEVMGELVATSNVSETVSSAQGDALVAANEGTDSPPPAGGR
ncbi:hypothetical protein THAOC_26391, partial [Thalassiosira oceanica]